MTGVLALELALVALAGCGGRRVVRPEPLILPECEIVPRPDEHADTVRVALFEAPRTKRAPAAGNAGERLLFGQLYETLITVDCLGDMRPALAASWDRGDGGRRWTFELREDALFWDGTPVTARDVVESWRYTALDPMTRGTGTALGSMKRGAGIDSVVTAGERILHVYFSRRHREVPRVLSASMYAVAKSTWDSRWPHGSGPYRIVSSERESPWASWSTITVQPAFEAKGPVVRFLETSARDARDLLESGIDMLVTADPAVIEYAAGRPRFNTVALPYDRTYILCAPSRVEELKRGGKPGMIHAAFSEALARDAVRGDARGCEPPYWWDELGRCGDPSAAAGSLPGMLKGAYPSYGERRILYDAADPVARDLAERIVALAAAGLEASAAAGPKASATAGPDASAEAAALLSTLPGLTGGDSGMIAGGVTKRELNESLLDGDDFAYIVPVVRRPPDPCEAARTLLDHARWLSGLGDRFREALIPLVDTRPHVIVRSGAVGLLVDWYGNLLILNDTAAGR